MHFHITVAPWLPPFLLGVGFGGVIAVVLMLFLTFRVIDRLHQQFQAILQATFVTTPPEEDPDDDREP